MTAADAECDTKANSQQDQWFVYGIRTAKDELYTGITKDVSRRFSEHQSGGKKAAKFLRGRGPLGLEYSLLIGSYSDALKEECRIKKLSKPMKEQWFAKQASASNV